jgi:hypothetical protein
MELDNSDTINKLCLLIKNKNISKYETTIKSIKNNNLSLLYYYSLFCIKNTKGNIEIASTIIEYIERIYFKPFKGTITLTFGDVAEIHTEMEKIGEMSENGFSLKDIKKAEQFFKNQNCETLLICLNDFLPSENTLDTERIQLQKAKNDNLTVENYYQHACSKYYDDACDHIKN